MEEAENPTKSRHSKKKSKVMKKFEKAELIAKNLPTGSYSAGCPTNYYKVTRPNGKGPCCKACEKKQ